MGAQLEKFSMDEPDQMATQPSMRRYSTRTPKDDPQSPRTLVNLRKENAELRAQVIELQGAGGAKADAGFRLASVTEGVEATDEVPTEKERALMTEVERLRAQVAAASGVVRNAELDARKDSSDVELLQENERLQSRVVELERETAEAREADRESSVQREEAFREKEKTLQAEVDKLRTQVVEAGEKALGVTGANTALANATAASAAALAELREEVDMLRAGEGNHSSAEADTALREENELLQQKVAELELKMKEVTNETEAAMQKELEKLEQQLLEAARIQKKQVKKELTKEEDAWKGLQTMTSALGGLFASAPQQSEQVDEEGLWFVNEPLSQNIELSKDCRTAWFSGPDKSAGYGFAITARPARRNGKFHFEICIQKARSGEVDGLAIGFTTTPPKQLPRELPESADCLGGNVWLVGYDGQFWDSTVGEDGSWRDCSFFPAQLVRGDCVAVKVDFYGKLEVAVNGETHFSTRIQATGSKALYGIVELLGNTDKVTLVEED